MDTSFIVACGEKRKDYLKEIIMSFGSVKFLVPEPVMQEIELIKKNEAKVGRKILEMYDFEIVKCKESADNCVIKIAKERGAYIASFDSKLRKRARKENIKLITVRKGAYVMDLYY